LPELTNLEDRKPAKGAKLANGDGHPEFATINSEKYLWQGADVQGTDVFCGRHVFWLVYSR